MVEQGWRRAGKDRGEDEIRIQTPDDPPERGELESLISFVRCR
jgi:hypothetical protein